MQGLVGRRPAYEGQSNQSGAACARTCLPILTSCSPGEAVSRGTVAGFLGSHLLQGPSRSGHDRALASAALGLLSHVLTAPFLPTAQPWRLQRVPCASGLSWPASLCPGPRLLGRDQASFPGTCPEPVAQMWEPCEGRGCGQDPLCSEPTTEQR